MKYLQSYKIYEEYKNTSLSLEKCKKLFLKHCKEFKLDEPFITRNVALPSYKNYYLIDPKSFERKSANTQNYYTYIIDNSDDWKDYPKRKNSIICSLEQSLEESFKSWLVIPYDGSKWGVCNTTDFWWSFQNQPGCGDLDDINMYLNKLYKVLLDNNSDLPDETKEVFFHNLNKLSDKIDSTSMDDIEILLDDYGIDDNFGGHIGKNRFFLIFFLLLKKSKFHVRKTLEKMLNPKDNNIQLMDYNELNIQINDVEVWTDSKCILLPLKDRYLLKRWRGEL